MNKSGDKRKRKVRRMIIRKMNRMRMRWTRADGIWAYVIRNPITFHDVFEANLSAAIDDYYKNNLG